MVWGNTTSDFGIKGKERRSQKYEAGDKKEKIVLQASYLILQNIEAGSKKYE